MKNTLLRISLHAIVAVVLTASCCQSAFAWSTYTHAALAFEAFSKYPALLPEAVFSSMLPDMTTNFISPSSKDGFYSIFHGAEFRGIAEALLKKLDPKKDRRAVCTAYGYLSHVAADPVAHAADGYPNARVIFSADRTLDHYVAYFFMDMLCYQKYFHSYNAVYGKYVPAVDRAFVEKALKGHGGGASMDAALFLKKMAAFAAGIALQKAIYDIVIDDNPELFEQIRLRHSDHYLGVNGTGGFDSALAAVSAKLAAPSSNARPDAIERLAAKELADLNYAAMTAVSAVARGTGFLRTGKLTSPMIEKFVDGFFSSRSKATQKMGRFLSALLLKRGLTYEEVIAYTEGVEATARGAKYLKFRDSYRELKKPRWYSFIPGARNGEKRECAERFAEYAMAEESARMAGLPPEERRGLEAMSREKWSAYREMASVSPLSPLSAITKKARYEAICERSDFLANLAIARRGATSTGNSGLAARLDAAAERFAASVGKRTADARKTGLSDAIFSPLATLFKRSYAAEASATPAAVREAKGLAATAAANATIAGMKAGLPDEQAPANAGCSEEEAKTMGFAPPATAAEAYALMRSAYEAYVSLVAEGADAGSPGAMKALKRYSFYSQEWKKLSTGENK